MNYVFKEGEEEKTPIERTIVKSGHVVEFSLLEMEHDLISFEKTLKELKANADNQDAIVKNMDQHHPFIKEMSEFDRYAVHMYQEAWAKRKAFSEKHAEIEKQYEEYKQEIADIKEQIPELAPIPSPYVPEMANPDALPSIPAEAEVVKDSIRYCGEDGCEAVIETNSQNSFCADHTKTDEKTA